MIVRKLKQELMDLSNAAKIVVLIGGEPVEISRVEVDEDGTVFLVCDEE